MVRNRRVLQVSGDDRNERIEDPSARDVDEGRQRLEPGALEPADLEAEVEEAVRNRIERRIVDAER